MTYELSERWTQDALAERRLLVDAYERLLTQRAEALALESRRECVCRTDVQKASPKDQPRRRGRVSRGIAAAILALAAPVLVSAAEGNEIGDVVLRVLLLLLAAALIVLSLYRG